MEWIRPGVAATSLLAALATMGTASAVPASPHISSVSAAPSVPKLNWTPCHDGFQCATAQVPLDYRHPDGATTGIAVIRHLATDRTHPAGTLFLNSGGPSAQVESFPSGFTGVPAALRERFDIVTFDERGLGQSSPVQCFPDAAAENKVIGGLPQFPVGAREEAAWEQAVAQFGAACARDGGNVLQHASSTDAARDMNLLRQAIGVPKISYEVEHLCVTAADKIEPKVSTATADQLAAWGWLMVRAAAAAARNNRAEEAREYAAVARTAAAPMEREEVSLIGYSSFGPVSAGVIGPEVELVGEHPDRALQLAERIPRDVGLTDNSTWSRHMLDVARANVRVGNPDRATEIMTGLRKKHPEWLRYQQPARDITREILATRPRMPNEEQRALAEFMDVDG
jgi:pimeloyl-ACP methyl ester carboxylesterase